MNSENIEQRKYLVELCEKNPNIGSTELYEKAKSEFGNIKRSLVTDLYKRITIPQLKYNEKNLKIIKKTKQLEELKKQKLEINKNNIVLLTKQNSDFIEKKLINDDDYYPFSKTLVKYFGEECIINNSLDKNVDNCENGALFAVLREIDRDNNTNVWRYGTGRDQFNLIFRYMNANEEFFTELKHGTECLPDALTAIGLKICNGVSEYKKDAKFECKLKEKIINGRSGLRSFASKVCKYLCEYLYKDNDKYFVNDRYVRYALPFYLDYYDVLGFPEGDEFKKLKTSSAFNNLLYSDLHKYLSALQDNAEKKEKVRLDKGEIDHIIWYSYKSYRID